MQQPVKLTVRESAGRRVLDMLVEEEGKIDEKGESDLGVAAAQQGGIDPGRRVWRRRARASVPPRDPAPRLPPVGPRRPEGLKQPVAEIAPVMVLHRAVADQADARLEPGLERGAALGRVGGMGAFDL